MRIFGYSYVQNNLWPLFFSVILHPLVLICLKKDLKLAHSLPNMVYLGDPFTKNIYISQQFQSPGWCLVQVETRYTVDESY